MNRKHKRPQRRKDLVTKNAQAENIQKTTRLSKANVKQITRRISGHQSAYEKLLSHELCMDLARKFARESAKQTGDDVGSVVLRYETIVWELLCMRPTGHDKEHRSLSEVLRKDYETDGLLKEWLSRLDQWIRRYVFACIDQEEQDHRWKLRNCVASADLMNALAKEHVRDRKTLTFFMSSVFKRWRKIYAPDSLHRVQVVTQQIAPRLGRDRKRILDHLQKIGAVPNTVTAAQLRSWLSRIGQYVSRDTKAAAGKNFGFGQRHDTE